MKIFVANLCANRITLFKSTDDLKNDHHAYKHIWAENIVSSMNQKTY